MKLTVKLIKERAAANNAVKVAMLKYKMAQRATDDAFKFAGELEREQHRAYYALRDACAWRDKLYGNVQADATDNDKRKPVNSKPKPKRKLIKPIPFGKIILEN